MDDPDMADFTREAERLIASGFPASAMDDPQTGPLIAAALIHHPMSARDSLGLLQRSYDAGRPTADLAVTYLTAALTDGSWRTTPLSMIPAVHSADLQTVHPLVRSVVERLEAEVRTNPAAVTPSVLVLAELMRRLITSASIDSLFGLFVTITPLLPLSDIGTNRWPRDVPLGDIDASVYARIIRPRIATSDPAFVRRIPVDYWKLFGVDTPTLDTPLLPNPTPEDLAVLAYAGLAFLSEPGAVTDQAVRVATAGDAVQASLESTPYISAHDSRDLTRDILTRVPAACAYVPHWVGQSPERISGDILDRAVFRDAPDFGLLRTLIDQHSTPGMEGIASAARVRVMIADPRAQFPPLDDFLRLIRSTVALSAASSPQFAPDVAEFLDAALIVARSHDCTWAVADGPVWQELYRQNAGRDDAVAHQLMRMVRGGVVPLGWTAGVAYLGEIAAQRENRPVDGDSTIARVALERLSTGPLTVEDLREACWPILALGSADRAEEFFQTFRKSGAAWLRTTTLNR